MYKTRESAEQAVIELANQELESFPGRKVNVRGALFWLGASAELSCWGKASEGEK